MHHLMRQRPSHTHSAYIQDKMSTYYLSKNLQRNIKMNEKYRKEEI